MLTLDEEIASELTETSVDDEIIDENGLPLFIVVQNSDWEGGGKYQYITVVFKDLKTNKLYRLDAAKTGSHYTDWYYDYNLNCPEVTRKERVITEIYYE